MPKLKFTNSKKSYLALFSAIGLLVFFYPHTAIAFDFFDGSWTIIPILKAALKLSGVLLSAAQTIFSWIVVPDNMTAVMDNSAVYGMWVFVRDFFNTTLIMILLFSAFATIFHASTGYHYKKVLLNLVLMALLVNFSYPIARFIIDLSNIFMYSFLNQLGGEGSFWSVIEKSGINKIITSGTEKAIPSISYLLAAVIFTFMFAVTMVTIAILLIIRTIALTVFIVFSPIAFLGSTQPGTDLANAASGWWKEFMKYCFSGPIMIFMLVLANRMMIAVTEKDVYRGLKEIAKVHSKDAGLSSLITDISFFSIPLVILWIGITKAQSSGIAGASMIVGQGTKVMKWAGKNLTGYNAAKWGAGALAHKAERGLAKGKYTWWMSPTAFKSAWKENQAELDRKAFKGATGGWRDKINAIPLIGDGKSKYKDSAMQNNILAKQKEIEAVNTDSDYLSDEFDKAEAANDSEKMAAILRILANNNDLNDFMKEHGESTEPYNIKKYISKKLGAAGMSKNQTGKQLNDLSELAFAKGNFGYYGMGKFNKGTGEYEETSDADQLIALRAKNRNVKAQTKADLWHWGSFIQSDANGIPTNLHAAGLAQLDDLTSLDLGQMSRVRGDFVDKMYDRLPEIRAHAASMTATNPSQAAIIDRFADHINGLKTIPGYAKANI